MKRSIMVGYGAAGETVRDEDTLRSTDAALLGVDDDETTSSAFPEKVYGLGWFTVDQPSSQPAPAPSGGVANCGVCRYNRASGTLFSLPPELFKGLDPRTKLTLTLEAGKPGVTFEWNPSDTVAQRVQFPRGMEPSPDARWVYLVIPGHDYSIPVPIVRPETPPRKWSMSAANSSPAAKMA